jgi:hypothetical protein
LSLFISLPLWFALEAIGIPTDNGGRPFMILLPIVAVGVMVWGYRDYRSRAALEVVIYRDRVTVGVNSNQRALNFADVDSMRIASTRYGFACVLIPRSGRSLRLPPEIAPFALSHAPLDETLLPLLVQRLDGQINRGEEVELRMPAGRVLVMTFRALGILVLGCPMLFNPWAFLLGLRVVGHATTVIHQLWLGFRGGFVMNRQGLRGLTESNAELTPWNRLQQVQRAPVGLVLRSTEGKSFILSSLTDNSWPATRWIESRFESIVDYPGE